MAVRTAGTGCPHALLSPQAHSNETIGSVRWKISEYLSCPVDNVQIFANDSVVIIRILVVIALVNVKKKYNLILGYREGQ